MSLIKIDKINKKYKNTGYILKNFSYEFNKNGLYVLYGPSGCGKTTLLNIINGQEDYDGNIYFNNKTFNNIIDKDYIKKYSTYITQNNNFIDYLTVLENLELCSDDNKLINKLINKFNLNEKINNYSNELSGGECARLSFIEAILKRKQIILLDEPTASLDKSNKELIYNILNELKEKYLIIVSSHDKDIIKISDNVIDYKKIENYNNPISNLESEELKYIETKTNKKLYNYFKKQNKIKTKANRTILIFQIILIISLLIIYLCCDINSKLLDSIENKYKINSLIVYCPYNTNECDELLKNKNITTIVYPYKNSYPEDLTKREGAAPSPKFETKLETLSIKESDFPFLNKIKYGTYFKEKNDIILSINKALELSNNPEKLIGTKRIIKMPDKEEEFNIVGIFDEFNDLEIKYFESLGLESYAVNNKTFINNLYTEKYISDDVIGWYEQQCDASVYQIYFNDFKSLYKVYNEYNNANTKVRINPFDNIYSDIIRTFTYLEVFTLPIVIISIILSLVNYYQILKKEYNKTSHTISVYEYYGYSKKEINKSMIKYNVINIIKILIKAFIISIFISVLINLINDIFIIQPYTIFNINYSIVLILFILIIIINIFMSKKIIKTINKKGWYRVLKEDNDLL